MHMRTREIMTVLQERVEASANCIPGVLAPVSLLASGCRRLLPGRDLTVQQPLQNRCHSLELLEKETHKWDQQKAVLAELLSDLVAVRHGLRSLFITTTGPFIEIGEGSKCKPGNDCRWPLS